MASRRKSFKKYYQGGYKKSALKIAKQLCYSDEVLDKIKNAKNDEEVATIMYVATKNIGE